MQTPASIWRVPRPSAWGPVSLVHSSSCPGRDCRLSEHTGSERSLLCLRSHSTAPSDSKLLSHSLQSSSPMQGCSPAPFGEWTCALCPKTFCLPFLITQDRQARGCSAGVFGGVQLKPVRVISEVDHGDNRAPGGRRGSTAGREGQGVAGERGQIASLTHGRPVQQPISWGVLGA